MAQRTKQYILVHRTPTMPKQIVVCPNKKCGREIVTEKTKGIKCRKCYEVFDL